MLTIKTTTIILYILFIAFFAPMPQWARVVTPDLIIQPISLDEALDASLAAGDGRRVDFRLLGF